MQMEMYMKESGRMIRHMEKVNTIILMGPSMKAAGVKISSMVKVLRHGQMVLAIKEII